MAKAGYKLYVAGTVLTAAEVNTYLMQQTNMQFASDSARDTALSAVLDEGLLTCQDDTNSLTVYSGAAWSTIGPVHGAWTAWTPTLTQSGAVTKTVTSGAYIRIGRLIVGYCFLTVTGTGTSSNGIVISTPVTAAVSGTTPCGQGWLLDESLTPDGFYKGFVALNTTTQFVLYDHTVGPANGIAATLMGSGANTFNAALAANDVVTIQFMYEAAGDA
jgi:hypothetical protein